MVDKEMRIYFLAHNFIRLLDQLIAAALAVRRERFRSRGARGNHGSVRTLRLHQTGAAGGRVERGQVLVVLDDSSVQMEKQEAEAAQIKAKMEVEKLSVWENSPAPRWSPAAVPQALFVIANTEVLTVVSSWAS